MDNIQESVREYMNQLTEKERIVLQIAKEHLASSFNILKSNGYKRWLKNKNN